MTKNSNSEVPKLISDIMTPEVLWSFGRIGEPIRITTTPEKESSPTWRPDGKKIGFLSPKSGDMQLWEMDPDGSNPVQITQVTSGITGFKYSPDGSHLLYTADVKVEKDVHDLFPDLPKANAFLKTDLMYKHWDEWVQTVPHPFVAELKDGKIETPGHQKKLDRMKRLVKKIEDMEKEK